MCADGSLSYPNCGCNGFDFVSSFARRSNPYIISSVLHAQQHRPRKSLDENDRRASLVQKAGKRQKVNDHERYHGFHVQHQSALHHSITPEKKKAVSVVCLGIASRRDMVPCTAYLHSRSRRCPAILSVHVSSLAVHLLAARRLLCKVSTLPANVLTTFFNVGADACDLPLKILSLVVCLRIARLASTVAFPAGEVRVKLFQTTKLSVFLLAVGATIIGPIRFASGESHATGFTNTILFLTVLTEVTPLPAAASMFEAIIVAHSG
nr:hypothetical protein CFP56_32332 [Quercus suber]